MRNKKYQLYLKDLMERGLHRSMYMKANKNIVHIVDSFGIFY